MIESQQLTRRYTGVTAVEDVSFRIGHGEVVGLLGRNGAGKTTVMKMLAGALDPSAGEVVIDGHAMGRYRRTLQRRIGYLPENCPVYPEMTVADYLDYRAALQGVARRSRPAALRRALVRTDLTGRAAQTIATLSRGYRQRVGVAAAIIHEPAVVILDEPTNGLDPAQIRGMRTLIRTLAEDATVLVSTHILQEVRAVCGRVLLLRRGRLVLDAPLDSLDRPTGLDLTVDAGAETLRRALAGLEGLGGMTPLPAPEGLHRFAIDSETPDALAPDLARRLYEHAIGLHALEPRRRDLEAVFADAEDGA
ncbi:ABC transporter ATP-binding protein [Arhodomonas aquaeolei]|uniref:ABC transporter ATP-binding protein n=1 Tax=Arhodomonas aquaeolei TaxID=2369 RepID=UPI002167A403|nr:ABC transporter ATP-binding protein [Arhodomonas aquaeolei]MCS4505448.1 ABC transporter ATP-binding protein [Arhodomonas aquaeolei]